MKKKTTNKAGKKPEIVLHGECIIATCAGIPADAVLEKHNPQEKHVIIAESEVTGNHHVIDMKPGVEFWKTGDGPKAKRYLNAKVPTTVRCVIADRHNAVELKVGTYEIGYQQEYDYITEAKRNVRD